MKKSLILSIILLCLFSFNLTVKADGAIREGEAGYEELKNSFDAGPSKITIQSLVKNKLITVYGKSDCKISDDTCNYTYFSSGTSVEGFFEKYITCSGGESKIEYFLAGDSGKGYKGEMAYSLTGETTDGIFYWKEDYYVSCLADNDDVSSGYSDVTLGDSSGSSSGGNVSGDFPSADGTVDNEDTGVITYYIVLGIIAVGAYGLLLVSKKYNLFKKI